MINSLFFRYLRQFDWVLLGLVFLLLIFGLIAQYSLSLAAGGKISDLSKQIIIIGFGLIAVFVLTILDFRFLRPVAFFLYFLIIAALVIVLFLGKRFHGVRGWLAFGPFQFQVVEIAKLIIIIVLARFWQRVSRPINFLLVIKSFILILPVIGLVLLQPDLGSAIVIILIWLGMLFLVDSNWKHYLILLFLIVLAATIVYFFILKDYQKERILVYFDPDRDPLGYGYQINQAKIAIGSGKLFGRGFAYGPQSQLRFLPVRKTDFIFAVIGEEFGAVGTLLVLTIFFFLFKKITTVLPTIYDNFGLMIVVGVLINLFIHFFFNISMNLGLLPVVGVPLPFISHGGSALLINLISIGIVESIIVHQVLAKKMGEI